MAEQSSRDVVDQTLSGGERSPSDVPASTNDKQTAGGDAGETNHTATAAAAQSNLQTSDLQRNDETTNRLDSRAEGTGGDMDAEASSMDTFKQGAGLVASRALELNGHASTSDAGDDTASQGGSESDASRTDGKHHTHTGSVKRPATFKPVSFAKFSVPKAPGAPAPPKAPEKVPSTSTTPLGTPQPSSRPRLVAKTTTGLRESSSKASAGGIKAGGSGPDPSQVWNKNRPVQATPAKHLTDEELKQQYGIHMTSRIQEDGGGSEAKWADIDDDEDDWAPDTIEWTDGTKVTLTHQEPAPQPNHDDRASQELNQPPPPEPIPARESVKAPKPTTSVGPNPTVLRLGANAERQAKTAIAASKGMSDRGPFSSTSSTVQQAKSPWATLPPVSRVSPVMPPVQVYQQSRVPAGYPQRDEASHAPLPPQEIAADDFNRTWRETQPGAPRELFNSRSGRYEPVPDTRRGSWRQDSNPRAPAVLQRPTHTEGGGPAEPSPAFQTHRTSNQDGVGWNRRRASSNVSGGSGGFGRRMSIGRPDAAPRHMDGRRGSQVNGMTDPALMGRESSREMPSSRQHPGPHWSARPPANMGDAAPEEPVGTQAAVAAPAAPEVPQEDPVAMQERIMKEKRMEARQRRIEQEEREEAAKQERIRQRLAALGPAPEKPERKESTEAHKPEVQPQTTPQTTAPATTTVHSPPKPPVPEPTGEPKQYGMMKVHHPDAVKKLVAASERERAGEKASTMPNLRRVSSPHHPRREAASANGPKQQNEPHPQVQGKPSDGKVDEQGAHWQGNLNAPSPYSPWTTNSNLDSTSPSLKNPWKPFSSDRTLGNGIFDQSLGGFPSRDAPLRSQLGLDQPSMGATPQAFSGPARSPQEPSSISPLPSPEVKTASYDPLSPIGRPAPIGPPSSQPFRWQQDPRNPGGLAEWNKFHIVAAQREAEEAEKFRQEFQANRDKPLPSFTIRETWKQVRPGNEAGGRKIINVTQSVMSGNGSPSNPLTGLDAPADGLPFSDNHARPLANVPARSSRFFPHATEQPKKAVAERMEYHKSPSPPPPEEVTSHPVYFADSDRPLVHLPGPRPVVKLPPRGLAASATPTTFASMAAAVAVPPPPPRTAAQPPSSAMSWQEKINGLFGKKTPPEKKSVLAVTSASKEPLDVQRVTGVSVSFPSIVESESRIGDGEITVQQVEEQEEMFEDREPGSLPAVRVPNMAPPAAWIAAPAPSPSQLRAKNLKQMQVHSVEPFIVGLNDRDQSGNLQVWLRLPGAVAAKTFVLPKKTGGQNSRHRSSPNFKARRSTKSREISGGNGGSKKPSSSQGSAPSSSPRHQSRNASWGPRTLSSSG